MQRCCQGLVSGGHDLLKWSWDDYIKSALAVFDTEHADDVARLLGVHFPTRWGADSIQAAPSAVQALARALGGIRQDQHLYVTHPDAGPVVFAAWWPWGNGKSISVRVGVHDPAATPDATREQLQTWFGLAG
ncbi:MAG: hypothetical protein BIFFINMI_00184 [Phycisphaerae bacterium]|nr:hypothetical protein [Phycisphaerae bacterium]